jgi:hypothetical protein
MADSVISGDSHNLALCTLVTVGLQLLCFLVAFTLQVDKVRR